MMTLPDALTIEVFPGVTLRAWLVEIMQTFWEEAEGFSPKRPAGYDSNWYSTIAEALEAAGYDDPDTAVKDAIRRLTDG